jgi:ATP-dependent Clp protease adaptor protein ClpS
MGARTPADRARLQTPRGGRIRRVRRLQGWHPGAWTIIINRSGLLRAGGPMLETRQPVEFDPVPVGLTAMTAQDFPNPMPTPRMADDDRKRREGNTPSTAIITKTKPQTKKPSLYRVLLLNDDYTPMEFVVHVLERFFNKDREAATRIMLHVHNHGIGECGVFTYEVAETKVTQVMDFARKHQHPLQCVMEKK